jgi:hypothetical protein
MAAKDLFKLGTNAIEGRLKLNLQLLRKRQLLDSELFREESPLLQQCVGEGLRTDWNLFAI